MTIADIRSILTINIKIKYANKNESVISKLERGETTERFNTWLFLKLIQSEAITDAFMMT